MVTIDRLAETERAVERPPRSVSLTWLSEATTWFALAVAGMLVVFAGLAVDAYRHNHSASEESLLSLGNPGHLLAAIGLAVTSAAILAGLSVSALKGVSTPEKAVRRFVPVTAAWVALATMAVASVTYIAASGVTIGHSHAAASSIAVDAHLHDTTGGDAGVVQALASQGIATDGTDPASVPGALTQGSNGQPGHQHDHGQQPTFTQLETLN